MQVLTVRLLLITIFVTSLPSAFAGRPASAGDRGVPSRVGIDHGDGSFPATLVRPNDGPPIRFTGPDPVPGRGNPAGWDINRVRPNVPSPNPSNPPARPNPPAPSSRLPESFELPKYNVPTPYQAGTSQCWKYAMTGVLEYLKNNAACNKNPRVGGVGDLSEQYSSTIFNDTEFTATRFFTDGPLAAKNRGYVLDRDLPYQGDMDSLSNRTVSRLDDEGAIRNDLPDFDRKILFATKLNEWNDIFDAPRGLENKEITSMKAALLTYQSPILFTYKPTNQSYWHTNMVVGFNEEGFIVQDSAFGDKVDATDPSGYRRRSTTVMPYRDVKNWGKFAAVYHLGKEKQCQGDPGRQTQFAHLMPEGNAAAKGIEDGGPKIKGSVVTGSGLTLE